MNGEFTSFGGAVYVPASIGTSKPGQWVADTGAWRTAIDTATASKLRLERTGEVDRQATSCEMSTCPSSTAAAGASPEPR